jgi:hypothetical protein
MRDLMSLPHGRNDRLVNGQLHRMLLSRKESFATPRAVQQSPRFSNCSGTTQAVRMKAIFGSSPDANAGIVKKWEQINLPPPLLCSRGHR